MGRFTLRDEGKTIAVGKVLKYKPYTKGVVGAKKANTAPVASSSHSANAVTTTTQKADVVFNMDTGEASEAKPQLGQIAEGDEDAE